MLEKVGKKSEPNGNEVRSDAGDGDVPALRDGEHLLRRRGRRRAALRGKLMYRAVQNGAQLF